MFLIGRQNERGPSVLEIDGHITFFFNLLQKISRKKQFCGRRIMKAFSLQMHMLFWSLMLQIKQTHGAEYFKTKTNVWAKGRYRYTHYVPESCSGTLTHKCFFVNLMKHLE